MTRSILAILSVLAFSTAAADLARAQMGPMFPGAGPGVDPDMIPMPQLGPMPGAGLRAVGPASARMKRYVREITRVLGAPEIPVFKGNVQNAAATPFGVLYNPRFMKWLQRRAGTKGVLSVLAHEVAHKLNRDDSHFDGLTHPWDKELRADFLSGYALAQLGASMRQSTAALRTVYQPFAGPLHPSTPERIRAVETGWRRGRAELAQAKRSPRRMARAPVPRQYAQLARPPCVEEQLRWVPTPFGWQPVRERVSCGEPGDDEVEGRLPSAPGGWPPIAFPREGDEDG